MQKLFSVESLNTILRGHYFLIYVNDFLEKAEGVCKFLADHLKIK